MVRSGGLVVGDDPLRLFAIVFRLGIWKWSLRESWVWDVPFGLFLIALRVGRLGGVGMTPSVCSGLRSGWRS